MNFISVIVFLTKKSHVIMSLSLIMGVLSFIGASFIPKTYGTEVRLMMVSGEQGNTALQGLSALSGGMDLLGGGASGVDPLLIECFHAREIRYKMIPLFGFDTLYSDAKPRDLIVKAINEDLSINVDEATYVISVGYTGKDRKQNIDIVEYVVAEAISKYKRLQLDKISESTGFLRDKISVLNDSLTNLKLRMIGGAEKYDIINVDEQIQATALYLTTFEQKLFELKLKKKVTAIEYGPKSINVMNIESQIKSLNKELKRLKNGKSKAFTFWLPPEKSVSRKMFMETLETEIGLVAQLLKMTQVELLTSEAELRKNNSVVQVIQEAYYPDQKNGPKRILWVIATLILTFGGISINYIIRGVREDKIEIDEETRAVLIQLKIIK